jgi:sulfate adenylyltransferase
LQDHALQAARISPDEIVLADVRLRLDGVPLPFDTLGGTGSGQPPAPGRVRLDVSADQAGTAVRSGGLLICDTQSMPMAMLSDPLPIGDGPSLVLEGDLVALPGGPVTGERYRSAAELPRQGRARLVVVAGRPLTTADVEAVTAEARELAAEVLLLVPDAGPSPDGLPASVLLDCVDRAVAHFAPDVSVSVVTTALCWRRADVDQTLADAVGRGYQASRTLLLTAATRCRPLSAGPVDEWATVLGAVTQGQPVSTRDVVLADAVPVLLAWRPPRRERGLVVLFTGLSGSGKSTLAELLAEHLKERAGRTVTLLDGDVVRRMLSSGLGFSRPDRDLNVRRIGFVAAEIARHGGVAVCAPIAPYAESRAAVRELVEPLGDLVMVHVSTPLEECERRDVKGLYAKARAGLVEHFTGVTDTYEEPLDADLRIDTTGLDRDTCLAVVLDHLRAGGWIPSPAVG